MLIADRIRELRGILSRKDFSELVGIHQQTIYLYEKAKRIPEREIIEKICDRLNLRIDWLINGTLPMHKEDTSRDPSPHTPTVSPQSNRLEEKIDDLEKERRELSQENRYLWKENAKLREEIGDLKARLARFEERADKPFVGQGSSEMGKLG